MLSQSLMLCQSSRMDWLFAPLNYDFMHQALFAGVLIGILCPVVGTYLIVQRMALLGDVVAYAMLPGLAIANFLSILLLLGAFVLGIVSKFVTTWIQTQSKVKVDTAMTITFSSFFCTRDNPIDDFA